MRGKVEQVADEIRSAKLQPEAVKAQLKATRQQVITDWTRMVVALRAQEEDGLALEVEGFVKGLPAVRTEKESIAAGLLAQIAAQRQRRAPADAAIVKAGSSRKADRQVR